MPLVAIIYVLLCLLVGVLGRERRSMGLWGWFFFSLLLTPLVGAITLLLLGPVAPPPQR
ncbi:hypothetical protein CYFUS_007890 [Cystobacter fuscus]|uniref:Uncharacterized protein n=1 Tax=Cystobacter fuscus TaxID=43 RepID=A0A250JG17_9BACT|nr:hypothetical protein [Cystobacter fuscus]ATB42412.1 hypothetical protein CYFUS_007890 [Cystobacter fuscus]